MDFEELIKAIIMVFVGIIVLSAIGSISMVSGFDMTGLTSFAIGLMVIALIASIVLKILNEFDILT